MAESGFHKAEVYENRFKIPIVEKIRTYLWEKQPIVYPVSEIRSVTKTRADDLIQLADFIKNVFAHLCEKTFDIPYKKVSDLKEAHPYDKPDYEAFEIAIKSCKTNTIQNPFVTEFAAGNDLPSPGPSQLL